MFQQFFAWYNGLTDSLWGSLALFAVGVFLLIKGGDWFVDSAVGIAKRFHVPEIIIGATVVSIGTTLPEVMVSVTAAVNNNGAIAYGNAIGSIICNTALIAALTIAIRPAPVNKKAVITPVIFFFVSAAIYMVAAYLFGRFDRWLGIVMLIVFAIYMTMTIRSGFKNPVEKKDEEEEETSSNAQFVKDIVMLVVSAALIAVGADMLEGSSVSLATMAGIPTEVIGVTVVALCTSLPELVTAVTALLKGHGALSLGNIIGANIFNLVLVSGAAVTISPFVIPEGSKLFGFNTSQIIEIPLMVGVMALMTLPTLFKGKLRRWQGITLLCIYVAFVTLQVLIALKVV
ncbi:MAG: calcium/sodium antiporter [Acutalibacteraceae bacterium]|nr:calcium/sodium antiporter [Acutalibacteraceae bacterium]